MTSDSPTSPSSASMSRAALLERVRAALRGSGLAQREVARHIGLDETKLSKALNGQRRFQPDELTRMATATGVTVNWLMSGSEESTGVSATPPAQILPTRYREDSEKARKRRAIIEKAWWLFAEKGYSSVRVSDIAAACDTSTAGVHYYFPTKRDIFTEALRYSVKLAFDRQIAELQLYPDPAQRLMRLLELQLPDGGQVRAEMSIWLQTWAEVAVDPTSRETHSHSYHRWSQTVRDIVVDGQQRGMFVDVDPDELTMDLTSLNDGLTVKVLTGILSADQMRTHLEQFLRRNVLRAAADPAFPPDRASARPTTPEASTS